MKEYGAGELLDALSNLLPDDPVQAGGGCVWCDAGYHLGVATHDDDCEWVHAADLLGRRNTGKHKTKTEANLEAAP